MGRGGLLLIRRGAIFGAIFGAGGRLFVSLRRGCGGKSCLFVRFVRLHGGLVVIVASAVLGGFAVVVVVSAVVCGEGEGGIAGSDLSVPPGVRSHVGVGVGGIQGTAHKVPPGVLSSLFSGRRGATNAFACVGGGIAGSAQSSLFAVMPFSGVGVGEGGIAGSAHNSFSGVCVVVIVVVLRRFLNWFRLFKRSCLSSCVRREVVDGSGVDAADAISVSSL